MKRNLLKGALLALLMAAPGLMPQALADETKTTVKYARNFVAGDGYSAWSADDISSSTTAEDNKWTAGFTYKDNTGLYCAYEKGSSKKVNVKSTLQFEHTENTIQTVEFVWTAGSNPGSNSYTYVKIGNAIEIKSDQKNQKGYVIINEDTTNITNCNGDGNGNRNNDVWTVKAVINTATKQLTYFSLTGSEGKTKASCTIETPTSLGDASEFNTFTVGIVKKTDYATSFTLNSIKISEAEQSVQTAKYTINYKLGDTVLKTVEGTDNIGATVSAESPLTVENQRYYFAESATTSMVLGSNGTNTLDVAMRKAYEYNYTVVAKDLSYTVETGKVTEGDTAIVAYPRFILKDGKMYSCQSIDNEYRVTFTPDADSYTKELAYTEEQDKTNAVFLSEGEDLAGVTVTKEGNVPSRASRATCAYAASDVTVTTLTPGKYQIGFGLFAKSGNSCTLQFECGTETFSLTSTYGNATLQTKEITVNTTAPLVWKTSGDKVNGLDYIYICRTAEIAAVTDAKYATYSPSSNIVAPDNDKVKFYTAMISGNKIVLTPVNAGTVLKAGTGYFIAAEEASYEFALSSDEGTEVDGNGLEVAGADGVTATADTKYYVLTKRKDGKVGFGKVKANVTIPAGKCYIDASATASAASLAAEFLEITNVLTGIDAVDAEPEAVAGEADAYYTLQGVKLSQPVKGINIINGKKVLVK